MRITSAGHAVFAAVMIGLGIQGFIKGDFTAVWSPVPDEIPGRQALVYLCAAIFVLAGIGLLFRRTAPLASRVLLASFVVWLLAWRVRSLFLEPTIVGKTWSLGDTLTMIAGAWVLFVRFATDADRRRLGALAGDRGLRIARALYGLGLIPFGYAHFAYLKETVVLVPGYLGAPVMWAYLTGATFVLAGLAILAGVCARLAATLSAWQMALFFVLVWIPRAMAGTLSPFQWGEFAANLALIGTSWVVAESYRGEPWLGAVLRPEEARG